MFYVDAALGAGAMLELADEHAERAVYVAQGCLWLNGRPVEAGAMAIVPSGSPVTLRAAEPARAMLLGGAAIDGERHMWWNFVSSSKERIERAKQDWQACRFAAVPGETESIPLPEG